MSTSSPIPNPLSIWQKLTFSQCIHCCMMYAPPRWAHGPLMKGYRGNYCDPITDIFNGSIQIGVFPEEEWTVTLVSPLYKDGARDEPTNYRCWWILGPPSRQPWKSQCPVMRAQRLHGRLFLDSKRCHPIPRQKNVCLHLLNQSLFQGSEPFSGLTHFPWTD